MIEHKLDFPHDFKLRMGCSRRVPFYLPTPIFAVQEGREQQRIKLLDIYISLARYL